MPNNPTIVSASLSDKELQDSIKNMVTNFEKGLQEMVGLSNEYVGQIQKKLQEIGNVNFGGGSSSGGGSKATADFGKLQKAANDAKASLKENEQQLESLNGKLKSVQEQEANLSQTKQKAANDVANYNEQLKRQEQELANLKSQQQALADAEQKGAQEARHQQTQYDALSQKLQTLGSDLQQAKQRYKELSEAQTRLRTDAGALRIVQSTNAVELGERRLFEAINQYYREVGWGRKQLDADLKDGMQTFSDPRLIEILAQKIKGTEEDARKLVLTLQENTEKLKLFKQIWGEFQGGLSNVVINPNQQGIGVFKNNAEALKSAQRADTEWQERLNVAVAEYRINETNLASAKKDLNTLESQAAEVKREIVSIEHSYTQATQQSTQASQQKAQVDSQIAAKEKEIADTKKQIADAQKTQTDAEKQAAEASKSRVAIQGQIAEKEKQVADAKKTHTDAQKALTEAEKQSSQTTTKSQEKVAATKQETQAIQENVTARDRQIKKNKEVEMSFDQMAAAQQKAVQSSSKDNELKKSFNRRELQEYIDKLRELQAEYIKVNTQEGGGAKSDKVKADIKNLEQLIAKYQEILKNLDYVNSRQGTIDVKKWVQDLGAVDDRYKKLVRWYTVLEKEDQRRIASEEKANQKRLANLEKEKAAQEKVIKSYQDSVLKAEFGKVMRMPTTNIDEIRSKFERLSSIIANIRELGILSPEKIASADAEVKKLASSIQKYEKFEQERIAAEQKFIVEQAKEIEQTQTLEGRVRGLAKAAREYLKENATNRWSTSAYGKDLTIYAENDARAKGLSIEEQITRQLQVEKEMILQQTAATQQLNAERRKYVAPSANSDIYDITRQAIANKLGIKKEDVVLADASTDSIKRVNSALKQLQDAYVKLNAYERNSPIGKHMIQQMQELQRQTQQLRNQMSRPISLKDALGGSEKTLDDIAYKMRQLASYRSGLNIKTQTDEIDQVNRKYAELQKKMNEVMQKNQSMIGSNNALARSWNYMKNRLAFYFTVGASTQFLKNLIDVRSQYEMNERALGILIDSAERGTQIFNELSQMALVSPYTLIELSSAAKQLTAYDIAAKDVVDTTRRLADMAAAVGIPVERLTYALGQIKAYGYLNSRDARMFANAGIPLVKQLSEYYTELEGKLVSTADVYDRIKKKTIDYGDVVNVINHMTDEGGKFFDFQAKMADTLKVRLANLTLAWNNMLNDIGKESQGFLTWSIGALRDLFLQWKTLDKLLREAAGAFGLYKAIQLIILGLQTVTKSTLGLNARLTATGVLGTRLVNVFKTLGGVMKTLGANWWLILVAAAVELSVAIMNANEATKEFNKSMREGAQNTSQDLKKYIEQYKELRDSLYKTQTQTLPSGKTQSALVPQDIDKNEAGKAWEVMREQIELSSAASNDFVSRLLQIENVSDRLREGFKIIDDIQQVNAALKDMSDEALVVTQKWSAWWNAWQAPDGLFTNLKDFKVELDEIRQKYGDIANARYVAEHGDTNQTKDEQEAIMRSATEAVNDYDRELNRFRVDLDKYTTSLDNFANAMEFSSNPTKVAELYAKGVKQLIAQGQLNPQEAFDLQLQIEEARTNAMKLALRSRIADEESALKLAQDERTKESLNASIESNKAQLRLFENSTYEQTAYWNDFTKYIKERHISELSAAYTAMTDNGKKQMDFQSAEWQKYVHKWANSYEKSHNLATDSVFNRIKNWINDANTWEIFIKMTISMGDKKSVYKELGEWDKAADDAYKTMQRLDKEISRLRKKGAKEVVNDTEASADDKKLTQAIEERTQAQKDYNEAVANGGESKKKDAAGSKAQKQAESELQKALKDELQLIDKVRSTYKSLTKDGVDSATALQVATSGFDESVANINNVLGKYGIGKLDLTKFAGVQNPRAVMDMLQAQLDKLMKSGVAKPAEIKDLQIKLKDLLVDSISFDQKTLTDSLNNELGKLKDEYELAVELDANPELGNMFTQMFGLDTTDFPHTIDEYMNRVQAEFDKQKEKRNFSAVLGKNDNVFKASAKDWEEWGRNVGLVVDILDEQENVIGTNTDALDVFKAKFVEGQGVAKKWATNIVNNTKKLEYDLAGLNDKIAIKEKEQVHLREQIEKEKNEITKHYLELTYQNNEKAINELRAQALSLMPEYARVFSSIAEYSAGVSRRLQRDLMNVYDKATYDSANKKWTLTSSNDKQTILDDKTYRREKDKLTKEMRKSQSPFSKIKEAFKPSEVNGVVDYAKGIELISNEVQKLGNVASEIGNLAQIFGADEQTVEVINDVAASLNGVATAGQGIAQIASGDYIGGIASVASGLFSAISTWFDNSDKKILAQIKESERAVKRLELAYKDLEEAIADAYGTAVYGARQTAIANKELQLIELQRQLALEESRDSKHRDEDRILDLKGQIIDLRNEIRNAVDDITNDLLGISSVGDAAESLVSSMIDAFRNGEDYMKEYSDSFEDMINNMVMKAIVSKVIGQRIEEMWNELQKITEGRTQPYTDRIKELEEKIVDARARYEDYSSKEGRGWMYDPTTYYRDLAGKAKNELATYEEMLAQAQAEYNKAITPTPEDVDSIRNKAEGWKDDVKREFEMYMDLYGIKYGQDADGAGLSNLQQGIQSITEETAGALEAITNGISQQCYLQSDLLVQIRDTIQGFDLDIQLGTLSQILLQLQASYQTQNAIRSIMEGWSSANGMSVRVEMI